MLKFKIDYKDDYDNFPTLNIFYDKQFDIDKARFKNTKSFGAYNLFIALNLEDYAPFFVENTKNQNGFCGSIFELTMTDGSKRKLVGPWSGRSGIFNKNDGSIAVMETDINNCERKSLHIKFLRDNIPFHKVVFFKVSLNYNKDDKELVYVPCENNEDAIRKVISKITGPANNGTILNVV